MILYLSRSATDPIASMTSSRKAKGSSLVSLEDRHREGVDLRGNTAQDQLVARPIGKCLFVVPFLEGRVTQNGPPKQLVWMG